MKKQIIAAALVVMTAVSSAGGASSTASSETSNVNNTKSSNEMTYQKKYTNADFYKDGVFQEDVAKAAYLDMFEFYGYEMTPFLEREWWLLDFGLGDFENCGMGGVFWVNDAEYGYFSHDIYLLPGQMIPEHMHYKTELPAKMESWMVRNGEVLNYAYKRDANGNVIETPGYDKYIPESQKATTLSKWYTRQAMGELVHLRDGDVNEKGEGAWHFLIGGENGAIVHEYATAHDGAWFTNTKAVM